MGRKKKNSDSAVKQQKKKNNNYSDSAKKKKNDEVKDDECKGGIRCHQCLHLHRPNEAIKCRVFKCKLSYGVSCLMRKYPGEDFMVKGWICPRCRGMCNCKKCLQVCNKCMKLIVQQNGLEDLDVEKDAMINKEEELNVTISSLKKMAEVSNTIIGKLEANVSSLKASLAHEESQKLVLEKEQGSLREELQMIKDSNSRLQQQIQLQNETFKLVTEHFEYLYVENDAMKKKEEELNATISSLKAALANEESRMAAQVDQEGQNQPPHTLSDEAYTMPTGENNDFDQLNFKDICIISSDDEDDYDLGEVACRRRVQSRELLGKWTGINENEGDWKVVWPPIVIIRNTRSEQDENGKWLGMGTEELLECHKSSGAVQARHAFGPEGHKGISVLIFDTSVEGYEKAQLLSKKYECQSIGRDNWNDKPSMFHPNGSRQLYDYLATEQDLEDFNQGLPEKWKLTFELALYEEKIVSQSEQWNKGIQQRKERELNDAREERYRLMRLGEKEMRG